MLHRLALPILALLAFTAGCDLLLGGSSDECSSDSDCSGDDLCDSGECVECENDRDCDDDEECDDGDCQRLGDEGEGEEGEGEGEGEEGEGEGEGGEGEGEGCGAVPETGVCVGNVSQFCDTDTNTVVEQDCSDTTPALDCDSSFGISLCAAQVGQSCFVAEGADPELLISLCHEGSNSGCRIDSLEEAVCVNGGPVCTLADEGTCIGEQFIFSCTEQIGQSVFMDCAALGATCDNGAQGCLFLSGDICVPDVSSCDNAGVINLCPTTGACP